MMESNTVKSVIATVLWKTDVHEDFGMMLSELDHNNLCQQILD